jgi:hypothetical protein
MVMDLSIHVGLPSRNAQGAPEGGTAPSPPPAKTSEATITGADGFAARTPSTWPRFTPGIDAPTALTAEEVYLVGPDRGFRAPN